jgi:ABC-type glycerol-3-phosphate transport system substrate-binding protein
LGELFDTENMRPRISESAFVEALKENIAGDTHAPAATFNKAPTIPILGYSDRLVAVSSSSRNAASAFKLLTWLAGPDTSTHFARAGNGALPVRRSLASSSSWYDPALSTRERAEQARKLEASLSEGGCLLLPRMPGIDYYLDALDAAIKSAASGVSPSKALKDAAKRWEEITDAHEREAQRRAYLKHLGVEDP